MKYLFLLGVLLAGCVSTPAPSGEKPGGRLQSVKYSIGESFTAYVITVHYPENGSPYAVLKDDAQKRRFSQPADLFEKLRKYSPEGLPERADGDRRPLNDAGVIDITWTYSDRTYVVHRDLAMKRPIEWRVGRIQGIFTKMHASMVR